MGRASRHKRRAQKRQADNRAHVTAGDLPLNQLRRVVQEWVADGNVLFQRFTCEACDRRQMLDQANIFDGMPTCEACGHATDLSVRGAGFASLMMGPSCFVHVDRPVRRCDICQACPRCTGSGIRLVGGSPRGKSFTVILERVAEGLYPGHYACHECIEASRLGGRSAVLARMPRPGSGDLAA